MIKKRKWYYGKRHEKMLLWGGEVTIIEKYMKEADMVLEWGSGYSTSYFSKHVKKYVSIEHNPEWFRNVVNSLPHNVEYYLVQRNDPDRRDEVLDSVAPKVLRKCDRTIIREGIAHMPCIGGGQDWHSYMNYIKKPLDLPYRNYDVIFIDGRSRAMCGYVALELLAEDGVVIYHDFNNRERYHGILDFYDIIDSHDTVAVLKKKKDD